MTFPGQLLLGAPVGTTAGAILGAVDVVYPSDADLTLTTSGTAPQSTNKFLQVTSTPSLTATRMLVVPLVDGQDWTVQNSTTGGQSILVIGPSGTGVLVPNGSTVAVTCDGTNILVTSTAGGAAPGTAAYNPNWYAAGNLPRPVSGSDTNSGLSSGEAVQTMAEVIRRYGSDSPFLTAPVTWHQLSSQTQGVDVFTFNPKSNGFGMTWTGTNQLVGGTFSASSLTARTRGNPGNQLTLNFGTLPAGVAAGQFIHNVTNNSYATVTSISGTSFTVSQPVGLSLLEDDGWISTNSFQLFTPVGSNWIDPQPSGGTLTISGIEFLSNSRVWTVAPIGNQAKFSNCQFDSPTTVLDGSKCVSTFLPSLPTIYFTGMSVINCQIGAHGNTYTFLNQANMFGGSANATGLNSSSVSFTDSVADGDCQLWNAIFKGSSYIGATECDGTLLVIGGATSLQSFNGLNFLWGAGPSTSRRAACSSPPQTSLTSQLLPCN